MPPEPCDNCVSWTVIGFSWENTDAGYWKRTMLRECRRCKVRVPMKVHWVDSSLPVCSECLSQDFTLVASEEETRVQCNRCKNFASVTLSGEDPQGMEEVE